MKQQLIFVLFLFAAGQLKAQDTLRLTLDEAIALARDQSPQAVAARHQYRASYWNWRSHKADYLPSLSLNTYSSLNRSISPVTMPDGSDSFVHRNQLLNDGNLTINQNVSLLGGSVLYKQDCSDWIFSRTTNYRINPRPLLSVIRKIFSDTIA